MTTDADPDAPERAEGRPPFLSPGEVEHRGERQDWFVSLPEARGKAAAARALAAVPRLTAEEARIVLRSLPPDGVSDAADAPAGLGALSIHPPRGGSVLSLPEARGRLGFASVLAEVGLTPEEAAAVLAATEHEAGRARVGDLD